MQDEFKSLLATDRGGAVGHLDAQGPRSEDSRTTDVDRTVIAQSAKSLYSKVLRFLRKIKGDVQTTV